MSAETQRPHDLHLPVPPPTSLEATRDMLTRTWGGTTIFILIFAALGLAGAVALIMKISGGPEPYAKWGYVATVTAFLLSTAQAAPVIGFATRLAKGFWAVPIRRAAELYYTAGLVTVPLFIVLLFQLPDFQGRHSIWNDWPGAPHYYDAAAIIGMSGLGLAILYFTGRPDLAVRRDSGYSGFFARLVGGWHGTPKHWSVLTTGLIVLTTSYMMMYAYVHIFMVSDMAMSLVPHWKSAVYPAYHGISGFQAGVATLLLTLAALRRWGGMSAYIGLAQFWGLAKLLLALSLLFFYFTWAEFMTYWYGRIPAEIDIVSLLMFEAYIWLFVPSFVLNFILPFWLLIWNPIRVSINGPPTVAAVVLVGNFVDRVRIYTSSWQVAGPVGGHLDAAHLPGVLAPDLLDILVVVGAIAAVGALYLLAMRVLSPLCLWEYRQARLLILEQPYLATHVAVIAKPH